VTLSGLAGGEYLPLPASKGLAFPFLLTLDGYPTSPAIYAQGQRFSLKVKETPGKRGPPTGDQLSAGTMKSPQAAFTLISWDRNVP